METNELSVHMKKVCRFFYLCGLPPLWPRDVSSTKVNEVIRLINSILITALVLSDWLTFFTQPLTEKQVNDNIFFSLSHPVLVTYCINVDYHRKGIADILHDLCVTLKEKYNDTNIQRGTMRKSLFYIVLCYVAVLMALVSYGFDGVKQVIKSGGAFLTVIPAWPDIADARLYAQVIRVLAYLVWWIMIVRVLAVYSLVTCTSILLCDQYRNLQSYFLDLNNIFNGGEKVKALEQERREKLYEDAIKTGFKIHEDTLRCRDKCQVTFNVIFSGQFVVDGTVLCAQMIQMMSSERTMANTITILSSLSAVLVSTGLIMWNTGDVTVEAAVLPTAMFHSGWHHCRGSSAPRIKKMLVLAMRQSQMPVVITSFGTIEISHRSYLTIVKSAYSVFSILY